VQNAISLVPFLEQFSSQVQEHRNELKLEYTNAGRIKYLKGHSVKCSDCFHILIESHLFNGLKKLLFCHTISLLMGFEDGHLRDNKFIQCLELFERQRGFLAK